MVDPNSPYRDEKPLIRRGRVDSLDIYEVKEHELELLENGSAGTLQFNFAIFLFSIALTCIAALATADFKWEIVKSIFVFTTVVGLVVGSYLMLSWWRTRTSLKEVVSVIKNRINGQIPDVQIPEEPETQPKKPQDNEGPNG
ncbi:MAG: hypothetical protein OXH00_09595 [Candidatus Poribacteria bacterium]|nr:hypothetical protein [Candidatus Poribacteria bacterium]